MSFASGGVPSGGMRPAIPPGAPTQTIDQFYADYRTGDILIFSGKRGLSFSSIVRELSPHDSRYGGSHVAASYVKMTAGEPDQIMVFESTQDWEPPDLSTGKAIIKNGPKLSDLKQKLAKYDGCWIAVRHIRMLEGTVEEIDKQMAICKKRMEDFIIAVRSRPYESDPVELAFSIHGKNQTNTGEYFCTEVLADLLEYMGIIKKYKAANNYTVSDFQFFNPQLDTLGLLWPFFYEEPIYTSLERK